MNEQIIELIKDICWELEIEVPEVSDDVSMFPTDTTMAMVDVETNTIHIRNKNISPDLIFSIIHELRHLWQWKTDKNKYFDDYKNSGELLIEKYNLQPAEIDANAYAGLIMIDEFGLEPQWNGMSDNVVEEIEKRMTEISKTW